MTIVSRPLTLASLAVIFIVAGMMGGPGNRLEPAVMAWMWEIRSAWPRMAAAAAIVTESGSALTTLGLATLAALFLLLRKAPASALLLAVTVIAERYLVEGLKLWIGRPRPPIDPGHALQSLAYPSGHSANSLTAFLAVALIAVPPPYRWSATIAALILSFLVGLSRILLGVHWPSDVVGGWALGLMAVGVALALRERSSALRDEAQHQIVGRHRPSLNEDEVA